ncbi:MAG: hypothetical protein [Caudoviricetes sp.]|nr:MAG: hypothetical protein [Caudoviricetes sp.]
MSLTNGEGTPFTMPVAPVGAGNNGGGFGGWGGDALIALIMMFLFPMIYGGMGWGGMGMMGGMGMWPWMFGGFGNFGGNGGNCGCSNPATQADVQRAVDQQTLISKIDQQTYGISQATYDINNTLQNGFSSAELSRCNQQAALMQMLYQMSSNQQDCCCKTQSAIEGVNYNLATQGCETRNTIQNSTRDIIDSQNSGFRAILDKMCQQELAAKDAQIAAQNQKIFGLELSASQQAQNNYLVNQLRPCPTPAYITCNPWASQAPYGSCGTYGNGCGCGCG